MGHYDPLSEHWVLDDVSSPCIDWANPSDDPSNEPQPNGGRANMGAYGATAYASKSPDMWPNNADLNQDGTVDIQDFVLFSENWLWKAPWY